MSSVLAGTRVGVLASGSGTNLQALIDADARGELGPARLITVGVNVDGCGAIARARAAGLDVFVIEHGDYPSREAFDEALVAALRARDVELVVLAGFMRLLSAGFLAAFPDRVVNIHPSLLPAFPGVNSQGQALRSGVKIAGCTVHLVDTGVDSGPILAQAAVLVHDDDDEESLRLRILGEEHRLLPGVVRAIAEGRVTLDPGQRRTRLTPPSAS